MLDIGRSTERYEAWMRDRLGAEFVAGDLGKKHDRMREGPFPFLRATFWRWAELVPSACPEFAGAPEVLAVGDVHVENFGTWRDAEGRLVWGVNDVDEAAPIAWPLDLVRLATSVILLARPRRLARSRDIAAAIEGGYRAGTERPAPIVLDRRHGWLRDRLALSGSGERARFWAGWTPAADPDDPPPARWVAALAAALPADAAGLVVWRRSRGTGSRGRPRWAGLAEWRGGPALREAKAVLPSAWTRDAPPGEQERRCMAIASGAFRAADPWFAAKDGVLVRRISPNGRKIEVDEEPEAFVEPKLLDAMGRELAAVHAGTRAARTAVRDDLSARRGDWLRDAAVRMADLIEAEQARYAAS